MKEDGDFNRKSIDELINSMKNNKGHFAFLIGAGTSKAADIPTSEELLKEWQKERYKMEGGNLKSSKKFKDWIEKKEKEIKEGEGRYGFWFEQVYPTREERRKYIRKLVEGITPSFGIIILASMMEEGYCPVTLTPNFDDLLYDAFYLFLEKKPLLINHDALAPEFRFTGDRPEIIKLHGDYLYDNLKNLENETERLTKNMEFALNECLREYGLIVVGYGGNDKSIMNVLKNADPSYGIWWCARNEDSLSEHAKELLNKPNTFLVKIKDSEEFFTTLWLKLGITMLNPAEITERAKKREETLRRKMEERGRKAKGKEKEEIKKFTRAFDYVSKAIKFYDEKDYKKTIEFYNKALEINPKYIPSWWNNKGVALSNSGEYKEAIKCYDKALKIDPKFSRAWYNKGSAFHDLEKYKEAIKCYDKAIEINPEYAAAWNNKGVALEKQEKYKEAIKCYDKAIEINPNNIKSYQHHSEVLIITGKLENALVYAKESLKYGESPEDTAIGLMLFIIAKTLLGEKITEEKEYGEICSEEFTTKWDFETLDSWLEKANIPQKKKDYIQKIMNLLRKHKAKDE